MSKSDGQEKIVIVIEVAPPKDGKRRILVTGAPVGELPAVYTGVFADLHKLVDQVWIAVNTRKPLPVTSRKGRGAGPAPDAVPDAALTPASDDDQADARREMVEHVAAELASGPGPGDPSPDSESIEEA